MLVRQTWVITLLYPFIIILVVGKYSFLDYFTQPGNAFPAVLEIFTSMTLVEAINIIFGFIGTIVAGIVMRALIKAGYQMFRSEEHTYELSVTWRSRMLSYTLK